MVTYGRWLFLKRAITMFLIFLITLSISMTIVQIPSAGASDWAGWHTIDTIYYNPAQEDAYNDYLETAATELETYLEQMSGNSWSIVTSSPPASPAIYLIVNPDEAILQGLKSESYRLVINNSGITITGKTALAVRHGAYDILDRLGVRWFFKGSAWTYVPDSLSNLTSLDITSEPDFFWRGVRTNSTVGQSDTWTWNQRNRVGGDAYYYGGHSYATILTDAGYSHDEATYNAHPDWFLPTDGYQSYPWQLNPEDNDIIQFSIDYALDSLDNAPSKHSCYGDSIPNGAASITPNDGPGYDPPYSTDLAWTNAVFSLSNEVAKSIKATYPTAYIATPCYAGYSEIPTITLEPNILVHVTTGYNYSDYTIVQRIEGIRAQGGTPGIRDFVDIFQWYYDAPGSTNNKVLVRIPLWQALGAESYEGEAMDNWGGRGHIYYALSRLLWNSSLDLDDIYNDFYTKAFGAAAATMKEFYENRGTEENSLAYSIQLLDQAETEAAGDDDVLARIRQLECYTYYVWKFLYVDIDNLTNGELETFYTFINKIRDWYLVTYSRVEESVHNELTERGYTSSQVAALQDFNPPTNVEIATRMAEMVAEFGGNEYATSEVIDPLALNLTTLNDTTTPKQSSIKNQNLNILVPTTSINETITVRVKGDNVHIQFYDSSPMLIDTFESDEPITDWYNVNFTALAPGMYVIHASRFGSYMEVDVPNRAASILAAPGIEVLDLTRDSSLMTDMACFWDAYTGYFYVPSRTNNFTLKYAPWTTQTISGTLTDPNNTTYDFSCVGGGLEYGEGGDELEISSPVAGLWKIEIDIAPTPSAGRGGYFGFEGIPPLVWHDPEFLLVQATGPAAPPVLHAIGDKEGTEGQLLRFTILGTDPNGDHLTYSASNLPPWATFNPATRTFSGTPNQPGTYSNVHFQVSDGSQIDSEDITITISAASDPPVSPPSEGDDGGGSGGGGDSDGSGGGDEDSSGTSSVTSLGGIIEANGLILEDIIATDIDSKVELWIYKDTLAKNKYGQALNSLTITPEEESPSPNQGSAIIGQPYKIAPDGATFEGSVILVFRYSVSEIPADVPLSNLYIALWDPDTMTWIDLGGTVDTEARTVSIPINHLSTYTLMIHNRPASISVTNFTLTPNEVDPGEVVTASIDINNQGDLVGTYEANLVLDNVVIQNRIIALNGGSSETIVFTIVAGTVGEHQISLGGKIANFIVKKSQTPAAFAISELKINPTSINSGDKVNISVLIKNTGDLSGTYPITLSVDDVAVETREVTLDGGGNMTLNFSFSTETAGEHTVNIGDLQGVFEVKSTLSPPVPELPNLVLNSFSTTPDYDEITNTLVSVRIEYQMNQSWLFEPDARLMMTVLYNNELLEQIPLFTLENLIDDGKTGELNYIPSAGWMAGEYTFWVELYNGENVLQATLSHSLVVTPKAVAKVVSWWTLGAVIGIATILIMVLLAVIVYHRRDMLRS
jgi:hypothetical protein